MKFSNEKKNWGQGRIGGTMGRNEWEQTRVTYMKFNKSNSKLMSSIVNISLFNLRNFFSVESLITHALN